MNVVLYSMENCPRCEVLKTKLKEKNIKFTENTNEELISDLMAALGFTFLPMLEVDGVRMELRTANEWINEL